MEDADDDDDDEGKTVLCCGECGCDENRNGYRYRKELTDNGSIG